MRFFVANIILICCASILFFFDYSPTNASAGANIQTNKNNYRSYEPIEVFFSGAPGNNRDWVCISLASSPDTVAGDYQYLPYGATQGTLTFTAPSPGQYEVRAYYNYQALGYVVTARSAISVIGELPAQGNPTQPMSGDQSSHNSGMGMGYFMSELTGNAKPEGGLVESVPVTKKYNVSEPVLWNAVQDVLDEQGYFFSADSSSGRIKTDPRLLGDQNEVTMFGATYSAVVAIKVRNKAVSYRARFNKQSNVVMAGTLLEYPEKENELRRDFFSDLDAMLNE